MPPRAVKQRLQAMQLAKSSTVVAFNTAASHPICTCQPLPSRLLTGTPRCGVLLLNNDQLKNPAVCRRNRGASGEADPIFGIWRFSWRVDEAVVENKHF
jgi:hypothetical protein